MKTRLLLAASALVPGIFLMQANGGTTVAVVDFERAVRDAPGGSDAISKITTFRDEQLAAITAKQKEGDDLENRLRVQDRTLSEPARAELTRKLEDARTAVQKMGEEVQNRISAIRNSGALDYRC